MTTTRPAAYGMYPRNIALTDIVYTLNRAGFENHDICMVLSPSHPVATVVRDARIDHEERETSAANARTIGWFSEFGAVVIPTVGFFIGAQAFFRALVVQQNSQPLCGGSGTLLGLGFSEGDAKRLDHQLSDFGVLVYVSCQENAKAEWAIELLRRTGAREAAGLGVMAAAGAVA